MDKLAGTCVSVFVEAEMDDKTKPANAAFKCGCGQSFKSEGEFREHQKSHGPDANSRFQPGNSGSDAEDGQNLERRAEREQEGLD